MTEHSPECGNAASGSVLAPVPAPVPALLGGDEPAGVWPVCVDGEDAP
jgi:hypothetical protein